MDWTDGGGDGGSCGGGNDGGSIEVIVDEEGYASCDIDKMPRANEG